MKYSFLPQAEEELNQAVEYYESKQKELGLEFQLEVLNFINLILSYPKTWVEISTGYRRILLEKSPFSIVYSIENDSILIISIMNLHRKPFYWKNRIK